MKKIAVVGGHGVGKTTFCQAMLEVVEERGERALLVGEVVRSCPYPINDGMCEKTALWTITRQISLEMEAEAKAVDYVICDRSVFDAVLYLAYVAKKSESKPSLHMVVAEKLAMDWLKTYSKIVLVRGFNASKQADDGIRSQDMQFGFDMDELFDKAFGGTESDFTVESDDVFEAGVCRLCKKIL